mmetsp:Transcript_53397/g.88572  ORF Transcript_53397/g.88572 Transcript_53397/m.88572 type:complete len:413 (-) Transcript_53397:79-1317(-)
MAVFDAAHKRGNVRGGRTHHQVRLVLVDDLVHVLVDVAQRDTVWHQLNHAQLVRHRHHIEGQNLDQRVLESERQIAALQLALFEPHKIHKLENVHQRLIFAQVVAFLDDERRHFVVAAMHVQQQRFVRRVEHFAHHHFGQETILVVEIAPNRIINIELIRRRIHRYLVDIVAKPFIRHILPETNHAVILEIKRVVVVVRLLLILLKRVHTIQQHRQRIVALAVARTQKLDILSKARVAQTLLLVAAQNLQQRGIDLRQRRLRFVLAVIFDALEQDHVQELKQQIQVNLVLEKLEQLVNLVLFFFRVRRNQRKQLRLFAARFRLQFGGVQNELHRFVATARVSQGEQRATATVMPATATAIAATAPRHGGDGRPRPFMLHKIRRQIHRQIVQKNVIFVGVIIVVAGICRVRGW